MISQVPNFLTLVRIAACPVLVLLLTEQNYELAFVVFVFAGVTDGLDGYIAKRFNWTSSLGAILDPLADKFLIASAYIMLVILQDIPFWLLVAVVFRDFVIISGYLILVVMGIKVPMKPTYVSKLNTFLQITLVGAVLVDRTAWLPLPLHHVIGILIFGVLVTTVISGCSYVWSWGIQREESSAGGK